MANTPAWGSQIHGMDMGGAVAADLSAVTYFNTQDLFHSEPFLAGAQSATPSTIIHGKAVTWTLYVTSDFVSANVTVTLELLNPYGDNIFAQSLKRVTIATMSASPQIVTFGRRGTLLPGNIYQSFFLGALNNDNVTDANMSFRLWAGAA